MEIKLPFTPELAERFDGLYQYLSRKYQLEQKDLRIRGRSFRIFSVRNLDDLLDELIQADPNDVAVKDERLPYWAELWPASLALAEFILATPAIGEGDAVLELGCGLGLAGIAASVRSRRVLITDYQPDALRFAELNWLLNVGESPAAVLMDWRRPDLNRRFDVILASDVVYEKRFFRPVIDSFHTLLTPEGKVLLSEPNRAVARPFFNLLRQEGFDFRKTEIRVPFQEKNVLISVYEIRRSEASG